MGGTTKRNMMPILIALTASVPTYTTVITTISGRQRVTQIVSGQHTCQSNKPHGRQISLNPLLMWHKYRIGQGAEKSVGQQTGHVTSCKERRCLGRRLQVCFNPLWLALIMRVIIIDCLKGLTLPTGWMALDIQSQAARTHVTYMLASTHICKDRAEQTWQ